MLEILNRQKVALKGLVRDTGTVFEALTERDQALAGVITGSNETFEALAQRGRGAGRVVPDPAHVRARVAPDLRSPGRVPGRHAAADPGPDPDRQGPLADAGVGAPPVAQPEEPVRGPRRAHRPSARRACRRSSATLNGLAPGARRARPVPRQPRTRCSATSSSRRRRSPTSSPAQASHWRTRSTRSTGPGSPRHYLRQLGYLGAETLGVHEVRLSTNRSNGYLAPGALTDFTAASSGMFPSFDCRNLDYSPDHRGLAEARTRRSTPRPTRRRRPTPPGLRPVHRRGAFPGGFGSGRFPTLFADP